MLGREKKKKKMKEKWEETKWENKKIRRKEFFFVLFSRVKNKKKNIIYLFICVEKWEKIKLT